MTDDPWVSQDTQDRWLLARVEEDYNMLVNSFLQGLPKYVIPRMIPGLISYCTNPATRVELMAAWDRVYG